MAASPEAHYGKGLKLPDLYQELPLVENFDREIMFDIFARAKQACIEEGKEIDFVNIFANAKLLALRELKGSAVDNPSQHHFLLSLVDPGLEVMRYFPNIAQRLEINTEREFAPLWDYVNPDLAVRLKFKHWNYISRMLYDLPELKSQLLALDIKPALRMHNTQNKHGLSVSIRGEGFAVGVRGNIDEFDLPNAEKFAGSLGPRVFYSTNEWIVEELLDYPTAETYDLFTTRESGVYGNLLGQALNQIHRQGYSYNSSLNKAVRVNPESGNIYVTNWCNARPDNQTSGDLESVQKIFEQRYRNINSRPYLSTLGQDAYYKALTGFYEGYYEGQRYPLSSTI